MTKKKRRSKRIGKAKTFGLDFFIFLVKGSRESFDKHIPYYFNIEADLITFEVIIKSQVVTFWKEVIDEKMDSIMSNNTWRLVDLSAGSKPIGCK